MMTVNRTVNRSMDRPLYRTHDRTVNRTHQKGRDQTLPDHNRPDTDQTQTRQSKAEVLKHANATYSTRANLNGMHAEGEAMKATCRDCGATFSGKQEHCTLAGCHMTFSTTSVGDAHRVGEHGVREGPTRRRCLTPDEYARLATKAGVLRFAQNARGVWHGTGGSGWVPKP